MNIEYYLNRIKLQITGGILTSEIDDNKLKDIVNLALQDINRYYDETQLIEVTNPGGCIDLAELEENNNIKINNIATIYRTTSVGSTTSGMGSTDPMTVAYWNMANNFGGYGTQKWAYRYMAYNTAQQITNTLSTDLSWKEDKLGKKLYVNFSGGTAYGLTIEYIPLLENVDQIVGNYWIEILSRLSLAYTKITLGRIRTRYKQDNALWSQDGDTLLEEGNAELTALRERLQEHSDYIYPVD